MSIFNKIYCIHLINYPDRKKLMTNGFNRIFNSDENIKFWETVRKPWLNDECANIITEYRKIHNEAKIKLPISGSYYDYYNSGAKHILGTLFDCAYQLYSVLTIAKNTMPDNGKIAIFEDDFNFINDTNIVKNYLNNMPEDYDMIRFYSSGYTNEALGNFVPKMYVNYKDANNSTRGPLYHGGIGFLALSKKGVDHYIHYLENIEFISDTCLMNYGYWCNSDLKCYFPTKLLYIPDYNNQHIPSTVLCWNF